jgi:hypothetical protein
VKDLTEVKENLGKFFIEVGKKTERELVVPASSVSVAKKESLKTEKVLDKPVRSLFTNKQSLQAKILNKQKIP